MFISTNWTSPAITRIKTAVRRYSSWNGRRSAYQSTHVDADARVMTNITAIPIPIEVSISLETPKKEQSARNRISTILFINIELSSIMYHVRSLETIFYPYFFSHLFFAAIMKAIVKKAPGGIMNISDG